MEHSDNCDCPKCYEEWIRLNTCDVCDDLLDDFNICERCTEREEKK